MLEEADNETELSLFDIISLYPWYKKLCNIVNQHVHYVVYRCNFVGPYPLGRIIPMLNVSINVFRTS